MKNTKRMNAIILMIMTFILTVISPSLDVSAKNTSDFISRNDLQTFTTTIGEKYDINPYILQAMAEAESSLYIYAENKNTGCKGLMQVSEKWHSKRMKNLGVSSLFDPYGNILVATDYLSDLKNINEDYIYMLMRYNMATKTADELYEKGEYTDYALNIIARADELENAKENQTDITPINEHMETPALYKDETIIYETAV